MVINSMDDNYESFRERVYMVVADIPHGYVLSYGALALLAGRPGGSRLAGRAMSQAPRDTRSHRVVNSAGQTVPGWEEQRALLEAEGIIFKPNGCVDMKKHLWRIVQ